MPQRRQFSAELERLVGRLTLELEVAKKAVLLSVGSSGARSAGRCVRRIPRIPCR